MLAMAALPFAGETLVAQQQNPQYVVLYYSKAAPGKTAEWNDFARNVTAKLIKAAMDGGAPVVRWSVAQVQYPGTHGGVTHIGAMVYDGPPREAPQGAWDGYAKKALGMTFEEYQAKLREISTGLGSELLINVAMTPAAVGDYRVMTFYKSSPGRQSENLTILRTISHPIHAARVKSGQEVAWSAWRLVFPRGTAEPYDHAAATTYKDRASAITAALFSQEEFSKIHPDKSWLDFVTAQRENRQAVRTLLTRVIASQTR
jgi:hypothetical protein